LELQQNVHFGCTLVEPPLHTGGKKILEIFSRTLLSKKILPLQLQKMEAEPRSCNKNDARLLQTTKSSAQSAILVSIRDYGWIGMD
jgi:hypothetical protein